VLELLLAGLDVPLILSFDGRIVEIHGRGAVRFHLQLLKPLRLELQQTKRSSYHLLYVGDNAGSTVQQLIIDDVDLPATQAFVQAVNAAIATRTQTPTT
jgi:hypothetical protein